jgi:cytochrome c oxidase assembly protein subunit 15
VGIDYEADALGLPAATAIHYAHRVGALLALLYAGWLGLHLLRVGHEDNLCRYGLLLLVMLSFATALGVMAVQGGLVLPTSVGHSAAAALLLMSLVTLYHVLRPRPTERK